MAKRRVAITGSSGLVGSRLTPLLEAEGWSVEPLVRGKAAAPGEIAWDPVKGEIDAVRLDGVEAVINLAGISIAGRRWSSSRKRAIRESRIDGTRLLAKTLAALPTPPAVLVSASAVGYYGDGGQSILTESAAKGAGFLADVCEAWEAASRPAADAGIRVANPRFGVVMAKEGGMLAQIARIFKLGIGGKIGNGRQYQSWIDIDDLTRALLFLLDVPALEGPVNAVAPEPSTNAEFTRALGSALHRPAVVAVPAIGIELLLGEMGKELVLVSQRAVPDKLQAAGFTFHFPNISTSLNHQFGAEVPRTDSGAKAIAPSSSERVVASATGARDR